MKLRVDLFGKRFSRLYVVFIFRRGGRQRCLCRCDCGKEIEVMVKNLESGHTRSCGCLLRDTLPFAHRTHGCSRGAGGNSLNKRAYGCWCSMKSRCKNTNHEFYADYGGRGITVCERWVDSFENFLSDMCIPPSGLHTIERKDVNGIYEIGNCCWATMKQQSQNKRPYRKKLKLTKKKERK